MAKRLRTTSALAVVVMMLVSACGTSSIVAERIRAGRIRAGRIGAGRIGAGRIRTGRIRRPQPPALNLPAVPTGYTELDQALGADKPFNGKKVSIQTQWTGGEGEGFAAAIKDFQTATGIAVQVDSIGSSHETVLKTRIEGGSPPDMAALAQPTAVLAYAKDGKVQDIATFVGPEGAAKLKAEFPSTIGLTSEGDHIWSIPTKADVKSMIWYPVEGLRGQGLHGSQDLGRARRPGRQDRCRRQPSVLRQRRRPRHGDGLGADGLGRGSPPQDRGSAGHQRLDQRQDQVHRPQDQGRLRQGRLAPVQGRLRRRRWPGHRERRPQDRHGSDVQPGHGRARLLDAEDPRLVRPGLLPGSSRTNGGDSKYTIGDDGDIGIFPFPTISDTFKGAEGSADSFMVLNDRPEVRALAEFLATPEGLEGWIKSVGVLSPNVKVPAEWYADNYKLKVANDIASGATAIGFDASDLMPPAVGQGSFWTGISDWANSNGSNTDSVLQAIDDSWPK